MGRGWRWSEACGLVWAPPAQPHLPLWLPYWWVTWQQPVRPSPSRRSRRAIPQEVPQGPGRDTGKPWMGRWRQSFGEAEAGQLAPGSRVSWMRVAFSASPSSEAAEDSASWCGRSEAGAAPSPPPPPLWLEDVSTGGGQAQRMEQQGVRELRHPRCHPGIHTVRGRKSRPQTEVPSTAPKPKHRLR